MNPRLYVAWRADTPNPVWGPVGRLSQLRGVYSFCYTRGALTLPGFEPFSGMEDLNRVYESRRLFPLFENRLLPKSRPEYRKYLHWSGFDPDDPPQPLVLLGRTEGRKQTDSVEVFPQPVPDSHGCYVNYFFAHGIRYHLPNAAPVLDNLHLGDRVMLRPQPQNPKDANAVGIFVGETPLGYVPKYLAAEVGRLIRDCPETTIKLAVERINPDAPTQQRLLCRLDACWPPGFQPCQDDTFQPLVAGCKV
ncbi:HIRAN domain-containing protein [Rhodopirellula sp. P2]|uniref:HIRAN domain-containing protein n=1 Tax=Rhodopirellula sp. P2 TaxID=2127060 RepID=UPI00236786C1|nr:HIRAN domain-containing protein [Rhodopirellula sp. P2]WDQ18821.1 HIRAN domain-containing protein [Rhodopirellula sp. P2]